MSEPTLHTLVYALTNRHQVVGNRWDMHDIHHYPFLADMNQSDAYSSALVDLYHFMLIHSVHHDHEASMPLCITSFYRCAWSSTHQCGSPLPRSSTLSRKMMAVSLLYR